MYGSSDDEASSGTYPTRWEGIECRALAIGVIDRAFRDLTGLGGSRADQESARVFLAGSSMFYYWCAVANLNPTWMVARVRTLMAAWGPFNVREVTQGGDFGVRSLRRRGTGRIWYSGLHTDRNHFRHEG